MDTYEKIVRGYQETNVMDKKTLETILYSLNADYLFQASAGQFQSEQYTETAALTGEVQSMTS